MTDITSRFYIDGKQAEAQLNSISGLLLTVNNNIDRMNKTSASGFRTQGNELKTLALRFVGYNLVLNQVISAQRKVYDYVVEGISKFREFQTRIAEVSTIMTGDYGPALEAMKTGIVNLSLETGQATSDLTKGLYDIMSAAFSAKDAMNLLNTATKASIAGLSDVRTSVDIFTTVLNSYGMSVYEATKVSDTLFQSVVRGKFQFQDLESALGYVVPIASQAGIAFKELMAALSTATRHGLHLDMASRGLAMALQNIINPSEGAAKAAKQYGIELSGLALRIKGISGVFGELNTKTKEYGKIVLNEIIPNIRSLRVAMVLAGEEGLQGLLTDMELLSVSAGRTEQAFQKIVETSQFTSNRIKQDWEKTQREVGEAWDKLAIGIQRGITDIVGIMGKPISWIPIMGPALGIIDEGLKDAKKGAKKLQLSWEYLGETFLPERRSMIGKQGKDFFQQIREQFPHAKTGQWVRRDLDDEEVLQNYLTLQGKIMNLAERTNTAYATGSSNLQSLLDEMELLTGTSAALEDRFNRIFGDRILEGTRNLEDLQLTLDEIEFNMEELREHLEKPIQYGWKAGGGAAGEIAGSLNMQMAQLKADQDLADAKYDIKMGLIDEDYQYKVLNADMQEAIRIIREHEKVTKQDTEAINLMNIALRKVQIEMLELQLVGMMRRRGLTRSEERRMKKLEIQAAKLRLENMKNTKAETASQYLAYEQAKQMIDEYVAAKEHESYILKYNYDQQVIDLQTTIDYENGLLIERQQNWRDTTDAIIEQGRTLITELSAIFADKQLSKDFKDYLEYDIGEMLKAAQSIVTGAQTTTTSTTELSPKEKILSMLERTNAPDWVLQNFRGFQRGTEYVHHTGLALVHEGEKISAAGKEGSGGTQIGTVVIQIKEIADIASVEKLGALLSMAKNAEIIDEKGRNRYGLRIQ